VRRRELASLEAHDERLRVDELALARRRIPHVSDGDLTRQSVEYLLVEHVAHQSHRAVLERRIAVPRDDTGALLAAVLQSVEPEVRQSRRVTVARHAEYAALLVEHPLLLSGRDALQDLPVGVDEPAEVLTEAVLVHDLAGVGVVETARVR